MKSKMVKGINLNEEKITRNKMNSLNFSDLKNEDFKGQETEVRLTKFNRLPSLAKRQLYVNELIDHNTNDIKSSSIASLLSHHKKLNISCDEFNFNRKWCEKSSINTVLGSSKLSQTSNEEEFQIVWRGLSFLVSQSAQDKLISRISSRTRNWFQGEHLKSELSSKAKNQNRRVIFKNLNGYVKSGQLSAILGPSGSGKTSLLNAICGRTGDYRGSIQLIGGGNRRMRLSIIPQNDYLMENLTVRENLLYSSKILNTDEQFNHEVNIMRVVKMLNLTNCLHSSASKISGGEYKRVSIAQELLIQPDILILDEPTSGLDSLNCKNLIRSLVQLIEASQMGNIKPIAIVMTIHQPDVDIFQMFDHVYCMARYGRVVYDGHPSEALNWIKSYSGLELEVNSPTASYGNFSVSNPANLLIEIASEDIYGQKPIDLLSQIQKQQFELYLQSVYINKGGYTSSDNLQVYQTPIVTNSHNFYKRPQKSNRSLVAVEGRPDLKDPPIYSYMSNDSMPIEDNNLVRDKRLNAKTDHTGRFWYHTSVLTKRAFTSTLRDPLMTMISIVFHLTIPFIFWTVYSKRTGSVGACPLIQRDMDVVSMVSNNTMGRMEEMQEELSLAVECSTMFFLSTYSFSMCSLSIAALAFPLNMHILLKEVRNGWYNLPSYVVAKTVATFPFEVLFPVISLVMIYLMLGMPSSYLEWRLWTIAFIMALISMISHTQGLIFGALCMDSVQTAIFLASASTLPQTLLSGFTARIRHMPILLQKLSWLSLYRYSCDAINIIRFGFGICPCDSSTDEYLRTKQTSFTDIPSQMKPLFTYYLTNVADNQSSTSTIEPIEFNNGTYLTTNSTHLNSIVGSNESLEGENLQIPGISYDLTLNSTARSNIVKMIENNELDLFGRMAEMMARSFTFGRVIDNCDSVRSELLTTSGAPRDYYLPFLLGGMMGLLVAMKLILFLIVNFKIGCRI